MFLIGVIGDEKFQTINLLSSLYSAKKERVFILRQQKKKQSIREEIEIADKKGYTIGMIALRENDTDDFGGYKFSVVICLKSTGQNGIYFKLPDMLDKKSILIINSDDKTGFCDTLLPNVPIITCGLNNKASLTVSSMVKDEWWEVIQCCVQRTIVSLSGKEIVPQEFSVRVKNSYSENVSGILAAVAAAMAEDTEFSDMDFILS